MSRNYRLMIMTYQISDIISAKEPTYDGEAEIISEIIEPSGGGLDIPTIIYSSAAEAINLTMYPDESEIGLKIFLLRNIHK